MAVTSVVQAVALVDALAIAIVDVLEAAIPHAQELVPAAVLVVAMAPAPAPVQVVLQQECGKFYN